MVHCLMKAWDENEPRLKGWLIKQTGNQDQAQDLLQDVFIKAMQHKTIFCSIDNAKSWLFKVAKNSFIDAYRKNKGHTFSTVDDVDIADPELESDIEAPITDLQQCLIRVVSELDEEDKEIIEQCDMQGVTQADYAKQKQLTLSATKSRIQRARKKLREQMIRSCNVQFKDQKVCCFTPRK